MTTKEKTDSIKKTARVAGLVYLIPTPFFIFSLLYIPSNLIVPGDAATTATNIMASEGLFRNGIVSHLIGQTFFILVPLILYKLLKPVNKNHALLMVIFILVAIPIALINELNQFAALSLLSGADYLTAFGTEQLHTQVMFFLDLHELGIKIASIFWGLWLLPMGYLVFESGYIPRFLGVLLIIAGFGHVIDFAIFSLFPNLDLTIGQFTGWGEVLFPLWLLIKGVNVEQWEKRALESI